MISFDDFVGVSTYSDVELCFISDNCDELIIPAHRVILSAASSYFAGVFHHFVMLGESVPRLEIDIQPGVDPYLFTRALYAPESVQIPEDRAVSWLLSTVRFGATALLPCVEDVLINCIDIDYCIPLASLAARCGARKLMDRSVAFLSENFSRFLDSELKEIDPQILSEILRRGAVYAKSEDQILRAVSLVDPSLLPLVAVMELSAKNRSQIVNPVQRHRFSTGVVYDWTITHYSNIERFTRSPVFHDELGHAWSALLYPRHTKRGPATVAVYLYAVDNPDGDWTRLARFKLKILHPDDHSRAVGFESIAHRFEQNQSNYGWSAILKSSDCESMYVEEDCLTVRICVAVTRNPDAYCDTHSSV